MYRLSLRKEREEKVLKELYSKGEMYYRQLKEFIIDNPNTFNGILEDLIRKGYIKWEKRFGHFQRKMKGLKVDILRDLIKHDMVTRKRLSLLYGEKKVDRAISDLTKRKLIVRLGKGIYGLQKEYGRPLVYYQGETVTPRHYYSLTDKGIEVAEKLIRKET